MCEHLGCKYELEDGTCSIPGSEYPDDSMCERMYRELTRDEQND